MSFAGLLSPFAAMSPASGMAMSTPGFNPYELTEAEKQELLREGLLSAGLRILAANDGRSGAAAIGQGLLGGLETYQRGKAQRGAQKRETAELAQRDARLALQDAFQQAQMQREGQRFGMEQQRFEAQQRQMQQEQERQAQMQQALQGIQAVPGSPEWAQQMAQIAQSQGDMQRAAQFAQMAAPDRQQQAYFQALPTEQGYAAFNARTGELSPLSFGGQNIMPATASPAVRAAVAAAEAQAREQGEARGQAAATLGSTLANANQTINLIDQALAHPGRETATGASSVFDPRNYAPGTEATDFQAIAGQLQGKTFLEAFQSLKGGGAITQVEGQKAEDAIARLKRAQSDEAYRSALLELRGIVEAGMQRAQQRAGMHPQQAQQPQQQAGQWRIVR